ncbi:ComF family protein [Methylobacterium sp. J-078]|uniref:ComF family protein n=1 Tax=Methylobacterium sp. J-078 TaxID=2836657 RepID=UPI001FB9AC1A|nr:ComF family protein [Methylobacterium sp. J-078]MCJ2044718.1 ComF family protein [Methylobacterium sp. J-078]
MAPASRTAFAGLRRLWGGALSLVYPPTCAGCGGAIADPHALCAACWSGLRLIERPYCQRLGTPFAVDHGTGALLSPRAIADPPVFDRARAVTLYEGGARDLVHRLKYEDRLDLAPVLARMMEGVGSELLRDADCLVPVPLHRFRLWRRRFNQAALLAERVGRIAQRPSEPGYLARVKATRSQVGLSRVARATNLQGAFRVPEAARAALQGRRILLIDDVMTTGATANAASRVLLRAGAASVDVLTFALVSGEVG